MSYTADQLITIAVNYEKLAANSLVKLASQCNCENLKCPHGEKPCHNKAGDKKALYVGALCDECAERMPEKYMKKDAAKEKKKLDPKAKVRNRGTVCVPAEKAKDKKDHFPINDADQARNALARVHQYSSKPEWWSGSLKGLQDLVARKVKAKYPKINVGGKDKKSSLDVSEVLLSKYGQANYTPAVEEKPYSENLNYTPANQAPAPSATAPTYTVPEQTITGRAYPSIPQNVQQALNSLLRTNLKVDGKLGPETTKALNAFRTRFKVPPATTAKDLYDQILETSKTENVEQKQQSGQISQTIDGVRTFLTQTTQALDAARRSGQGMAPQNIMAINQRISSVWPQLEALLRRPEIDDVQRSNINNLLQGLNQIAYYTSAAGAIAGTTR